MLAHKLAKPKIVSQRIEELAVSAAQKIEMRSFLKELVKKGQGRGKRKK
jgi:hypothetical protein